MSRASQSHSTLFNACNSLAQNAGSLSLLGFSGPMKQLFREILFLGRTEDLDCLLVHLRSLEVPAWEPLCLALETLRHFRAYYQSDISSLSESSRAKVARYDADWTMQILAMIGV